MNYTLFIDESGNISKTQKNRYFCIGGYLIKNNDRTHIYKMKKILKNVRKNGDKYINSRAKGECLKKKGYIDYEDIEVKFSNLTIQGKDYVYDKLKELNGEFVSIVVDKHVCTKLTTHNKNDYYNYLVKLLIEYIFEKCNYNGNLNFKELKIIYDNRSMRIEANNDLQLYLLKKLKMDRIEKKYSCNFNIREADSKFNYGVMIGDFVAGLCWARYNYNEMKYGLNFNINYLSKFPYKDFGKIKVNKKVLTLV